MTRSPGRASIRDHQYANSADISSVETPILWEKKLRFAQIAAQPKQADLMKKQLVLIGSGGHGRVVADAALAAGWQLAGFVDDTKVAGTKVNSWPVLGDRILLNDQQFLTKHEFIVTLGDQNARRQISLDLSMAGGVLATVIHPSCVVSPHATVGRGTVLGPGSILNANANVGNFCILNTGCTVDHDVMLADGVQISPGANLAGHVCCGEDVFIGTGAVIIPRVSIGQGAVVGAGAVVIRDVPAGARVAGNPARQLPPGIEGKTQALGPSS